MDNLYGSHEQKRAEAKTLKKVVIAGEFG